MTDEFLTEGLRDDRYLKAIRLVDQFEDEIGAILSDFDQRMVDEQPALFDPGSTPRLKTTQTPSNGLAYHRINHALTGPRAPEGNQRLNVHLYWMPPTEYDRTEVDGALRAFGYKIKNADPDIETRIVEQTRAGNWSLETSGNPYDSNTVFYRHVSSTGEIKDTIETLVDHFSEFGGEYAVPRNEDS